MSAIDEARRQEFGAVLDEADSDPQTTGVFLASAVATKEATDEDSNWLPRWAASATAVAIRKARGLANGWRYLLAPRRSGVAREAVLCAGNLPVGTVLARMIPISRKRLEQHAAAEAASR